MVRPASLSTTTAVTQPTNSKTPDLALEPLPIGDFSLTTQEDNSKLGIVPYGQQALPADYSTRPSAVVQCGKGGAVTLQWNPPVPEDVKRVSFSMKVDSSQLSPEKFKSIIRNAAAYPTDGTYGGVQVLKNSEKIDDCADGASINYQRTGSMWPISPRHYTNYMWVAEESEDKIRMEWILARHTGDDGAMSGPYAGKLNSSAGHVFTPYNHGYWEYYPKTGIIIYCIETDPGGVIKLAAQEVMKVFPRRLMEKNGVKILE